MCIFELFYSGKTIGYTLNVLSVKGSPGQDKCHLFKGKLGKRPFKRKK